MKKKLFGVCMIAMLILSQVMCVSAASKETDLTPAGDSEGYYEINQIDEEKMEELKQHDPVAADTIQKINNGEASLDLIAKQQPELAELLKGKKMLTPIVSVIPINGGIKLPNGNYLLHLSLPSLTSQASDIKILYYNPVTKKWEILTPSAIDWENKIITLEVKDLSQLSFMSVLAKTENGNGNGNDEPGTPGGDANNTGGNTNGGSNGNGSLNSTTGTSGSIFGSATGVSPKTGVTSDWMLWAGAAVVLLAVSAAALKKSEQK